MGHARCSHTHTHTHTSIRHNVCTKCTTRRKPFTLVFWPAGDKPWDFVKVQLGSWTRAENYANNIIDVRENTFRYLYENNFSTKRADDKCLLKSTCIKLITRNLKNKRNTDFAILLAPRLFSIYDFLNQSQITFPVTTVGGVRTHISQFNIRWF